MKVVRLSALSTSRLYPKEICLVLISIRDCVDPRAVVRLEGLCQSKLPMSPSGNKPATSQACSAIPQLTAPPRAVGSILFFFLPWRKSPSGPSPPHWGFMITFRHTTLGRTPLDEWLARRRDLYLTTHNTHNRQTPMPPAGFEPTISACERPQTARPLGLDVGSITKYKRQMRLRVNVIFRAALICYQSDQASDAPRVYSNYTHMLSPHIRQVQMHVVAVRHVSHYVWQFNNTQFVLYTMDSESTLDRQLIQFPWMDWLKLTHSSPLYNLCLIKLQGHTNQRKLPRHVHADIIFVSPAGVTDWRTSQPQFTV